MTTRPAPLTDEATARFMALVADFRAHQRAARHLDAANEPTERVAPEAPARATGDTP